MTDTVDKIVIQSETQGVQQSTDQLNQLGKSMDGVTVASQNVEKSTGTVDSKFASLERRFGTTAGQAAQLAKGQKTINDALALNPALQDRANEALAALEARFGGSTKAAAELSHASEGLTTQQQSLLHAFRSTTEGLFAGAPATQILAQQFGHLSYASTGPGGLSEAFSGVTSTMGRLVTGIGALVTPTNVAIASAVALGAAAVAAAVQYDRLQVSSQRAISGAGQRTGTTVSDLNSFTSQNASLSGTGLSTKEARTLAEDFTQTGDIVISRLHGMSNAVVGFANQTGQSVAEASKSLVGFATDPEKALTELSKTFGDFDVSTRKSVDALTEAGDKTGAFQVIVDALSEKSKAAAANMGVFEKATRSVINALSTEATKPGNGLESQLAAAQSKLSKAQATPNVSGFGQENIKNLTKNVEDLQTALNKVNAQRAAAELNKLSTQADAVDKAIIPQIAQLEQLRAKLAELDRLQAAGGTSKYGAGVDAAATTAIQNQIVALQDAQAQAARYGEQVKQISTAYSNVGQSTALALHGLDAQLPVAQAVGESAKLQAQYYATITTLLGQGLTDIEATALAAAQYGNAQAQIASGAEAAHQASVDQLAVVSATSDFQKRQAQYQADYNAELLKTGDELLAQQAAQDKLNLSQASATAAANSSANRSSISQDNSAATSAASSVNQMAASAAAAASSLDQMTASAQADAQAQEDAARAYAASHDPMQPTEMTQSGTFGLDPTTLTGGLHGIGSLTGFENVNIIPTVADRIGGTSPLLGNKIGSQPLSADQIANSHISSGDYAGALSAIERLGASSMSTVDTLVQQMNSMSPANSLSNLQAEMAWLNSLPETLARDQQITNLKKSIDELTTATNANTAASLNPLYTQGHGALAIGYYHAANGLDGVAQGGTPGVDSVPIHIMAMPGEPIKVGSSATAANSNQPQKAQAPVIVQNFDFSGSNTNNARRSRRQFAQGFGQTAAAMR